MIGDGVHAVVFYEREIDLVRRVGEYIAAALEAGEVAIVIATEAHRRAFEADALTAGADLEGARRERRLVTLDAGATLNHLSTNGRIDSDCFDEIVGAVVRDAASTGRAIRAYGEMVALAWESGNLSAAIELEALWNTLGRAISFELLCAYPSASVSGCEHAMALDQVCRLHTTVHDRPSPEASAERAPFAEHLVAAEFLARPSSPSEARRLVIEALQRRGHAAAVIEAAASVVTELATNAVVHARSPFLVNLSAEPRLLRIAVADATPSEPRRREGDLLEESGRGLHLIAALAEHWGVELTAQGKITWAELRA